MRMHAGNNYIIAMLIAFGAAFPGCLFDNDDDLDESDDQVWMSIAPIQCGGNAWEQEGQTVGDYLEDRGVKVVDIRTSTFAEAVCLACSCVNGQRIDLLVAVNDVPILLAEGFVRPEDWPY